MQIVDTVIIGLLFLGAFMGVRNGFTKELVRTVGLISVLVLAFQFKGILSALMYKNLPFFSYFGSIKGIEIFNILIYEIIAFMIILVGLLILLKIVLMGANIFEMLMKMTIILGFFSKILGAIVGVVQYFFWIFIALYILTLPIFKVPVIENSSMGEKILTETPYLSNWTKDAYFVMAEFKVLRDQYKEDNNKNSFNLNALDTFLKYKIISIEDARYLVEKGKIEIDQVEPILRKYEGE